MSGSDVLSYCLQAPAGPDTARPCRTFQTERIRCREGGRAGRLQSGTHCAACQLLGELRSCGDRGDTTTTTTTAQGPVQPANGMRGVLTKYLNSSSSPSPSPSPHSLIPSHTKHITRMKSAEGNQFPLRPCCSVLSCCKECEVDRCLGVYIVRTEQILIIKHITNTSVLSSLHLRLLCGHAIKISKGKVLTWPHSLIFALATCLIATFNPSLLLIPAYTIPKPPFPRTGPT